MAKGQQEQDGRKYVAIHDGKMFDPGTSHDYGKASWREVEMAILGAADTGTANALAAHDAVANPQTLFDGARYATDAAQALLDVTNALPEISMALSRHWTGATATAFMGALRKLHTAIVDQYDILTGQPSGRGDLSWVLMDVGNALEQAQQMVREIDGYYAQEALRLGAPLIDASGGGQLVAISRTPTWGDSLVQWMNEDMRQVMQQLANRYVEDVGNVKTAGSISGSSASSPGLSSPGPGIGTGNGSSSAVPARNQANLAAGNAPLSGAPMLMSVPSSVLPSTPGSDLSAARRRNALSSGSGSGGNPVPSASTMPSAAGTVPVTGSGNGSGGTGSSGGGLNSSRLGAASSPAVGTAMPAGMGGMPFGGYGGPGMAGSNGGGRRSSGTVPPVSRFPGPIGGRTDGTDPIAASPTRFGSGLTTGTPDSGAPRGLSGLSPVASSGGGVAGPAGVSGGGVGSGLSRPATESVPSGAGGPGPDPRPGGRAEPPGVLSAFPGAAGGGSLPAVVGEPDRSTAAATGPAVPFGPLGATGNRQVRLATTGRRLAPLSSAAAQHQGASLPRLASHPPGPPLAPVAGQVRSRQGEKSRSDLVTLAGVAFRRGSRQIAAAQSAAPAARTKGVAAGALADPQASEQAAGRVNGKGVNRDHEFDVLGDQGFRPVKLPPWAVPRPPS